MTAPVDVLAFSPHPDDVELFCGGFLATAAARGQSVVVVDLTRGEAASRGTVEERAQEAEAAARALGLRARENLALPDAGLDPRAGVEKLVEAIRRLRPLVVVGPWEEERHPDHEAAAALVERAVFLAGLAKHAAPGAPHAPRAVMMYPMRRLTTPSFVVDVTAAYPTKRAAIACYGSQVAPSASGPATLVGSPLSLSSLEARDAFYGAQIGVAYGEPFVVREQIAVPDPVAYFASQGPQRPLFFPERR